jgi:glycoprotein 2-beta-D-xylosyltransferase
LFLLQATAVVRIMFSSLTTNGHRPHFLTLSNMFYIFEKATKEKVLYSWRSLIICTTLQINNRRRKQAARFFSSITGSIAEFTFDCYVGEETELDLRRRSLKQTTKNKMMRSNDNWSDDEWGDDWDKKAPSSPSNSRSNKRSSTSSMRAEEMIVAKSPPAAPAAPRVRGMNIKSNNNNRRNSNNNSQQQGHHTVSNKTYRQSINEYYGGQRPSIKTDPSFRTATVMLASAFACFWIALGLFVIPHALSSTAMPYEYHRGEPILKDSPSPVQILKESKSSLKKKKKQDSSGTAAGKERTATWDDDAANLQQYRTLKMAQDHEEEEDHTTKDSMNHGHYGNNNKGKQGKVGRDTTVSLAETNDQDDQYDLSAMITKDATRKQTPQKKFSNYLKDDNSYNAFLKKQLGRDMEDNKNQNAMMKEEQEHDPHEITYDDDASNPFKDSSKKTKHHKKDHKLPTAIDYKSERLFAAAKASNALKKRSSNTNVGGGGDDEYDYHKDRTTTKTKTINQAKTAADSDDEYGTSNNRKATRLGKDLPNKNMNDEKEDEDSHDAFLERYGVGETKKTKAKTTKQEDDDAVQYATNKFNLIGRWPQGQMDNDTKESKVAAAANKKFADKNYHSKEMRAKKKKTQQDDFEKQHAKWLALDDDEEPAEPEGSSIHMVSDKKKLHLAKEEGTTKQGKKLMMESSNTDDDDYAHKQEEENLSEYKKESITTNTLVGDKKLRNKKKIVSIFDKAGHSTEKKKLSTAKQKDVEEYKTTDKEEAENSVEKDEEESDMTFNKYGEKKTTTQQDDDEKASSIMTKEQSAEKYKRKTTEKTAAKFTEKKKKKLVLDTITKQQQANDEQYDARFRQNEKEDVEDEEDRNDHDNNNINNKKTKEYGKANESGKKKQITGAGKIGNKKEFGVVDKAKTTGKQLHSEDDEHPGDKSTGLKKGSSLTTKKDENSSEDYSTKKLLTFINDAEEYDRLYNKVEEVKLSDDEIDERCEALIGNGFTQTFSICSSDSRAEKLKTSTASQIQCRWNPVVQSPICEARNLIVDPSKIEVSDGGEPIHHVKGRPEEDEFPKYESGALQVSKCTLASIEENSVPDDEDVVLANKLPNHLKDVMKSVKLQDDAEDSDDNVVCTSYDDHPTLLITRYEYANLYHSYTDWYNAYQAAMIALDGDRAAVDEVNIIFMDGHSSGALDEAWKLFFPNATISFVSDLQAKTSKKGAILPSCFRHAIFVPPGYQSGISIIQLEKPSKSYTSPLSYLRLCAQTKWQQDFRATMVKNSQERVKDLIRNRNSAKKTKRNRRLLQKPVKKNEANTDFASIRLRGTEKGTSLKKSETKNNKVLKILFVSRQDYHSHPRMDGRVTRRIENEDEVLALLRIYRHKVEATRDNGLKNDIWVSADVSTVSWEDYDVAEQVMMVQQADILVGMHGAGLSHILVARPGTMLLELRPPAYSMRKHFEYLSVLSGCLFNALTLDIPSPADPFDPLPVPLDSFENALKLSFENYVENHQEELL